MLAGNPQKDARRTRLPGNSGVWVFVIVDMTVFLLIFLSFAIERSQQAEEFARAQQLLYVPLGLVNTLILVSSSFVIAGAVRAARDGRGRRVELAIALVIAMAVAFCCVKGAEYYDKLTADSALLSGVFFQLYFVLTVFHLIHVIAGIVVFSILKSQVRKTEGELDLPVRRIESAATYWHMVDLLWIVIFTLFYLLKLNANLRS